MASKEEVAANILKVYNLAQRATGGEREAAAHRLGQLLEKYGWTIEDLETLAPNVEYHDFTYRGKYEKELLSRIAQKVVWDNRGIHLKTYYDVNRRRAGFDLTAEEAKEVKRLFGIYKVVLHEELGNVVGIFLYKHNLILRDGSEKNDEPVDQEEAERLISLLRGMRDVNIPLPENRRLR